MSETIDPVALRDLLATPPSEFVAARNALAKSLRAQRRRDEAAAVAGLRRPSWVDWALNAIAGSAATEFERFADTAAALRDAQAAAIEGRDGPDLRAALRAQREATTVLARLASDALTDAGRPPDAAEVAARLGEVAASERATQQLRSGVLGADDPDDPDDPGPFGDALGGVARPARRPGVASTSTATKRSAKGRATSLAGDGVDELAERRVVAEARKAEERRRQEEAAEAAAAEEAARLARDREVAKADVGAAESMLADAETTLAAAEQAVTDARAAVIQAKSTLRTARQRVEQLSRRG